MSDLVITSGDYAAWLVDLKGRIQSAQQRTVISVNREQVLLYWKIGRETRECQQAEGWGTKVINKLARDFCAAFPTVKGFSPRNLKCMWAFAEAWPEPELVQQAAAQLPWFHLFTLSDKLKTREEREHLATSLPSIEEIAVGEEETQ